ncbi:hypothetical protein GQ43DRAFT_486304 [Delitschia confertaspora ATCC 74209]|uniref:Uncharacterized protein n=1 Tax=Delitschia confertaspora ATCC 74209 TaxID=1513339 RepID=A0A9P4JMH6_9PLEO|nr:hypothetical protein GQ43DRAFT_486304 [Delitschia confertaspora ATCC 74209]
MSTPIYLSADTVVELLPSTTYNEDTSHNPRPSPAYLAAQTSLLTQLRTAPTLPFTPRLAHRLTRSISPSAAEAIRFCYYMRSLGLPTYARLDVGRNVVRLFVEDLGGEGGAIGMYWEQGLVDGRVHDMDYERERWGRIGYAFDRPEREGRGEDEGEDGRWGEGTGGNWAEGGGDGEHGWGVSPVRMMGDGNFVDEGMSVDDIMEMFAEADSRAAAAGGEGMNGGNRRDAIAAVGRGEGEGEEDGDEDGDGSVSAEEREGIIEAVMRFEREGHQH